ncbi:hypothetical protein LC085_00505 [Bacillus tianshenii]|uniref:hypothetical protein n=1 Tax=Sutcliffiella tianshenii TaxID=1463404 RepID=UPI001CD537C3|nr:hypothetical protein [Bacillus tianshenii]MCA1318374.1 hypothetical protein [Bacillus tianshenii]
MKENASSKILCYTNLSKIMDFIILEDAPHLSSSFFCPKHNLSVNRYKCKQVKGTERG